MEYNIIKKLTNTYSNIDKEMFYRSLYMIYKDKDIQIDLKQLGIPEHIYISLLDLPIVDIKNNTLESFQQYLISKQVSTIDKNDNIFSVIFNSMNNTFIIKKEIDYYFCIIKTSMYNFNFVKIPIKDFNQFYRLQKLKELIG
jgi:hypothetical protein